MLKDMPRDRLIRLSLLAMVAALALAALSKTFLQPNSKTSDQVSYSFPAAVPLPGWQLVDSSPLNLNQDKQPREAAENKPGEIASAQVYRFEQRGVTLEAKTYYIAPTTEGNVTRYIFVYSSLRGANANMQQRQQPTVGSYGVLTHEGRAYLTACTTNRGVSTLTEQQFTQNRSSQDLNVGNIIMWLAGQRDLLDHRCLWTLMAVPIAGGTAATPNEIEQAYRQLETAWVPWHQWWQQNFPPLTSSQ